MAKSTPAGDPADTTTDPPAAGFWRYVGGVPRIYLHVPVTVDQGDVIAHDGPPAGDGHWTPDPGPATRQPDNQPAPAAATGAGEE